MLLSKGHRHIAIVLPHDSYGGEKDSEQGLRDALNSSTDARISVLTHDESPEHLCSLVDDILAKPNAPTAFLVARSPHALAVTMHLMRRRRRVPGDVAVVTTDDHPILQSISPAIARYTLDEAQFARRLTLAARQLAESGILPANAIRLIPKFLPGETL